MFLRMLPKAPGSGGVITYPGPAKQPYFCSWLIWVGRWSVARCQARGNRTAIREIGKRRTRGPLHLLGVPTKVPAIVVLAGTADVVIKIRKPERLAVLRADDRCSPAIRDSICQ